ncbi:hypothetical protein [Actinopolyspora halophila]|uniref:hypothetical protein n=1 Tax=Actinopolyspora halophila TaxID=1850 RepID=UPI0003641435|nr:hypothetical protein [Actinopolyspora halophila]
MITTAEEYGAISGAHAEAWHLAVDTQIAAHMARLPYAADEYSMALALGNLATLHEEQATVHHAAMAVCPDLDARSPERIERSLRAANDKVRILRTLERIWLARCTGDLCPEVSLHQWPELEQVGRITCYRIADATDPIEVSWSVSVLMTLLGDTGITSREAADVLAPVAAAWGKARVTAT